MKILFIALLGALIPCAALADGTPTAPASQTEVNAGTVGTKFVSPKTLASWTGAGGGPTNGLTAAQLHGSLLSGTNGYAGTNFSGGGGGLSNLNASALTSGTVPAASINTALFTGVNALVFSTSTTGLLTGTDPSTGLLVNSVAPLAFGTGGLYGPASGLTNILHGNTVTAGVNIGVTRTQNPDGSTNAAVALSDPVMLSQLWATNFVTPTNSFAGTTVDFSHSEGTTNLGGNLTFTAVANITAGAYNGAIWHIYPGGADRTIAFPAGWHAGRGDTLVVSNAFNHSDFMFTVQPGVSTNVAQRDYP